MTPIFYHARWSTVWLCLALVTIPGSALLNARPAHAQTSPSAQRGWLGIVMDEQPGKVLIKEVLRGSPAEKARLQPGDQLLRVNEATVQSAPDTARSVGKHNAGSVVQITISRRNTRLVIPVRLQPFPSGEDLLRMQHVGRPAPPLQGLRTILGTRGPSLADFHGKVLLIDFWASFCLACRVTSNHLNQWHTRYASRGLDVLGIAAEPSEAVARGARRFGIRYPTCADPDMTTTASYHVSELPALMLVDRKGIVRDVTTGYDPARMRQMNAMIQRLLAEPPPAKSP